MSSYRSMCVHELWILILTDFSVSLDISLFVDYYILAFKSRSNLGISKYMYCHFSKENHKKLHMYILVNVLLSFFQQIFGQFVIVIIW